MNDNEKITRSVDSLERIYAVVVAFAVTKAIEATLLNPQHRAVDYNNLIHHLSGLIAFFVTIVPFYHGMHRHLNRVYIERTVAINKQGFLLLDFFVFFLESCLLLIFATSLGLGQDAYIPLAVLLAVDTIWAITAHGIHYDELKQSPWRWAAINSISVVALLIVLYSNLFNEGIGKMWALAGVTILRTFADYKLCWHFYFPENEVEDQASLS